VKTLRVGTRGSDLALWQTGWVCDRLREAHPDLEIERIIIKTHGDQVQDQNFGKDWPVGAFVSALENALLADEVDVAVHSFKDLQTAETGGLTIAATPPREKVHDLLLTNGPTRLEDLPTGARIGTNSPRRAAQLLQISTFEIVPIRGNLPTRVAKIEREKLDGVMLAAAGITRLGIKHPHVIELDTERMLPAPAQGALAVQTRADDAALEICAVLNDDTTRRAVVAEREVLARINAGCHTPVGALAVVEGERVTLRARMFTDDYLKMAEGQETGTDPKAVGTALADRLAGKLKDA
jgi:hydroxymethylbilane synthase